MNTNSYNQNILQKFPNFTVRVDGEVMEPERPSAFIQARTSLVSALSGMKEHVKLETALIVYDFIHKTHYRSIRHTLMAAKRNEAFEQKIGISRNGKA